jgi:hypothetical protein
MKTIKYYNPKNNRYQISEVLFIENDILICYNKSAKYQYKESLSKLREYAKKENPDWIGEIKKPLVILNF